MVQCAGKGVEDQAQLFQSNGSQKSGIVLFSKHNGCVSVALRKGDMTLRNVTFDWRAVGKTEAIASLGRQPEYSPDGIWQDSVLSATIDHEFDCDFVSLGSCE